MYIPFFIIQNNKRCLIAFGKDTFLFHISIKNDF